MTDDLVPIRSFRVCFKLERRIHKIDQWRIPLPFGVPLAGLGYAAVALLAIGVLAQAPLIGDLLAILPAPARLLGLPVAIAWALTRWEIDGRSAVATLRAGLRQRCAPARVAAFRPARAGHVVAFVGDVAVASDSAAARLRPAVVTGPARIVLRYPVDVRERRGALHVAQRPGPPRRRGLQVTVEDGRKVVIA